MNKPKIIWKDPRNAQAAARIVHFSERFGVPPQYAGFDLDFEGLQADPEAVGDCAEMSIGVTELQAIRRIRDVDQTGGSFCSLVTYDIPVADEDPESILAAEVVIVDREDKGQEDPLNRFPDCFDARGLPLKDFAYLRMVFNLLVEDPAIYDQSMAGGAARNRLAEKAVKWFAANGLGDQEIRGLRRGCPNCTRVVRKDDLFFVNLDVIH